MVCRVRVVKHYRPTRDGARPWGGIKEGSGRECKRFASPRGAFQGGASNSPQTSLAARVADKAASPPFLAHRRKRCWPSSYRLGHSQFRYFSNRHSLVVKRLSMSDRAPFSLEAGKFNRPLRQGRVGSLWSSRINHDFSICSFPSTILTSSQVRMRARRIQELYKLYNRVTRARSIIHSSGLAEAISYSQY